MTSIPTCLTTLIRLSKKMPYTNTSSTRFYSINPSFCQNTESTIISFHRWEFTRITCLLISTGSKIRTCQKKFFVFTGIQWLYQYISTQFTDPQRGHKECLSTFLTWFAPLSVWKGKLWKSAKATGLSFKKLRSQGGLNLSSTLIQYTSFTAQFKSTTKPAKFTRYLLSFTTTTTNKESDQISTSMTTRRMKTFKHM